MNSHSANPSLVQDSVQSVPDGAAMFPAESHRRALDLVAGAILERVPFIAITGNKGVGKTTVLEAAIARLAEQPVRFIRVGNPLATPLTLGRMLIQIANSGHGDPDENDEKRALIALRARQGSEEQVVLVVEEADTLRPQALSFLQLLTRISEPDSPLLQMLFVGRPSFWGLLEPAEFRELRERITVRAAVEPFSPEEAKSYIAYRLEREDPAGSRALSDRAIADVVRDGGGIPLRINALLDRARQPADALGTEFGRVGLALTGAEKPSITVREAAPGGESVAKGGLATSPGEVAVPQPEQQPLPTPPQLAAPSTSTGFGTRRFGLSVGVLVSLGGVLVAAAVASTFYRILPWSLASSRPHVGAAGQAANQPDEGAPQSSPVTTGAPLEAGARPTPPAQGELQPDALASANPSSGTGRRPATAPAETLGSQRLRRDFDAFLDRSGGDLALLTDAQRQALFEQYAARHPRPAGAAPVPPGSQSQASAEVGNPASPGHRVVIHFLAHSRTAESEANWLAASLPPNLGSATTRPVTDVPRIATLRYFWVEDKDAAQALAHNLGGPEVTWTVRDFTSFRPKPSPGTIEVWLPPP